MIKKDKSLIALSLGLAITSQNMMFASAAESIEDAIILSDDEVKIKINTDNQSENETNSTEYQLDPKDNNTYSMGGSTTATFSSRSQNTITINKDLSNPKAIGSGVSTYNNLNVRSGPSTSNSLVGTLKLDEEIEILGTSNDWYKIDFNGKEGYVSSSYIKLNALEKGIDVSKWNGTINWTSVKNSGIDYVIIRAGYGTSTVDPQFKNYIEGAKSAGLKVGVYWFSYATSVEKAQQEAKMCLETLSPYKSSITYPVFFDFEYASVDYAKNNGVTVTKNLATQMANAFLDTVKAQGYTTGLYTNKDFSSTYYNTDLLYSNNLWVAQYNSTNSFGKPYSMWQYSETGSVPGISGAVDLNYTCLNTFGISSNNTGSETDSNTPSTSSEKGVTTANLNLRKSASTSASILTTIPKDTTIEIIDKSTSGWYKVQYNGNTGYVSSSYVQLNNNNSDSNSGTTTTPSTSSEKGVTTANLNLRKSASTSASILTTIPKDTTIEVIDKSTSGWYKVKYKDNTGYVSSSYVQLNNNNSDSNSGTTTTPSTSSEKGVTTANLNFRKSASTSSTILATIPKNTTIEIVSKSASGWYKVTYKNVTGYVSGSYVELDTSSNSTSSSTSKIEGITTANLNFRKSASTSALIINTIPKNTTIEIVEQLSSGWYKVKYKGTTGYVSGSYISIKK